MPREHHPIADLFPMLADDELKELAADITERGLLQPIVLDAAGRILDGRNRHAACELAGMRPKFATYDGDDPDGYALSVNINRRHLTKGQQAMVLAQAGIEYRNDTQASVSKQRVSHARVVRDHAPDLAGAVISGAMSLDEAYRLARENKSKAEGVGAQLARLRADDSELADRVVEGELTLPGAFATLEERRREAQRQEEAQAREKQLRERVAEIDAMRDADGAPAPTFAQRAENGSITWAEAAGLAQQWRAERADAIKRAQGGAVQIVNHWGVIRTLRDQGATPYVADILAGLGENDRAEINRIITELKG